MSQTGFNKLLTYKSDTATAIPSAGNLTNSADGAELAVNTADKRLFVKDSGNNVVELGTNPSSITLPNGTANGVVYANGSKVLTTGSALTFDGTNLGVGTSNPGYKIDVVAANNTSLFPSIRVNSNNLAVNTNIAYDGLIGSGQLTVQAGTSSALIFGANNSEQMRLTSTGLGIGTSSPSYPLHVEKSKAGDALVSFKNTNATGDGLILQVADNAYNAFRIFDSSNATSFRVKGSGETYVAGNLGLGVTPSAWYSTWKAIDIGTYGALFNNTTSGAGFAGNAYLNTSAAWTYKNTAAASYYQQNSGQHAWYTAPSGTAGNAISFTQAMTLDASGNLVLGTTSASGNKLFTSGGNVRFDGASNADGRSYFYASQSTTYAAYSTYIAGNGSGLYIGKDNSAGTAILNSATAAYAGIISASGAYPLVLATNDLERMRIDSSGNVFVGGTTALAGSREAVYGDTSNQGSGTYPATLELIDTRAYNSTSPQAGGGVAFGYKYTSGGAYALGPSIQGFKENSTDGNYAAGLKFSTRPNGSNPVEAMRIDSSGNVIAGITSSAYAGTIQSIISGTGNGVYVVNTNTSDATTTLYGGRASGSDRFRVYGNGNVVNSNNSYGSLSDAKLKENIVDATPKLDKVNSLKVRNYNFIGDNLKQIGFVAQELELVFPSLIEETPDRDDFGNDLGTTTKSIKTSVLIPILVKAIQEQQEQINQLKAEIAAIKGV